MKNDTNDNIEYRTTLTFEADLITQWLRIKKYTIWWEWEMWQEEDNDINMK